MRRSKKKQAPRPTPRRCEIRGCGDVGEYKAPKQRAFSDSKRSDSDYQWLCLAHVKEYNKKWDFFSGMNQQEIEQYYKDAITGHRKTNKWDLHGDLQSILHWHDRVKIFTSQFIGQDNSAPKSKPSLPKHIKDAADIFEIELPKSLKEIKKRYKMLVKQYHPDVNKGCKASEEKFKIINQAYHTLLECEYIIL